MPRLYPQNILDHREGFVEHPRHVCCVLELDVVVDCAADQLPSPGLSGAVGEPDRLREVRDRVELTRLGVVRSGGHRLFDDPERALEIPSFQGVLCLARFRR